MHTQIHESIDLVDGLRAAIFALIVYTVSSWLFVKFKKAFHFNQAINKLPGPPISNLFLGNIPSDVLYMVCCLSSKHQQKLATDFYTSQIQSLLGHTVIYQDNDLFRVWLGREPVVCVWKPEIVEKVLGDNNLLEKSYHYDFLKPWLGNGLLTSPGRIWRSRRKLLSPSFHFNILQTFVPVFNKKSTVLVKKLSSKLNEASVWDNHDSSIVIDITPFITACALDAICETIMGVKVDAQEIGEGQNNYCESVYIVGETFLERVIQPKYWLDFVFRQTELGKLYRAHLQKLHSFTRTVIAERKQGNNANCNNIESSKKDASLHKGINSPVTIQMQVLQKNLNDRRSCAIRGAKSLPKAFLDLLLNYKNANGVQTLTDEEIREEVDTFMFEGHDTTAMALSWTIFLLGHYLPVQQRLAEEVDSYFADKNTSFGFAKTPLDGGSDDESAIEEPLLDEIKKLKYLDCVIKEALRLCPSVPFIGRKTTSDIKLGEHNIPAGTVLFVLIYQLHRNSKVFPNPEKFDPDRFLPHNTVGRHPFAYVPFSAGLRNCIGQKFAMAEMKMMLLNLIKNFRFESVTPIDKAKVQMEMVLRPKCKLNIRIRPRC